MHSRKSAITYLIGAMVQMMFACLIITILRWSGVNYPPVINMILLVIGGASTAFWGAYVKIKSTENYTVLNIIKDFFSLKQKPQYYGLVLLFIAVNFGISIIKGQFVENVKWYSFFTLFLASVVFGGIEEIGWRYTFQPILEKKIPFELACIITFICWGIWHYMYFYLTGTLNSIEHIPFLAGLLCSCFILGAIYRITNSLWLCVMYHCFLNVFSQTLKGNDFTLAIIQYLICIVIAVVTVHKFSSCRKNSL